MNAVKHHLSEHDDLRDIYSESNCDAGVSVFRWLARLWNAVVVPRVEEAIISRVTAKRSSASTTASSSPSLQRQSPSNCGLSPGQQAVVKAALSILVNKAVLVGCPLSRHGVWASQMTMIIYRYRYLYTFSSSSFSEMERYLLEFRGGTFPLSAIGSYKGSGGGGGRKGRESSKLRRSNTSPRKKGSPAWSCGGSFREGTIDADSRDTSCMILIKLERQKSLCIKNMIFTVRFHQNWVWIF